MKSRRTFLHDTAAVGAGVMLAQTQRVHASSAPGYVDRLVSADGKYAAAPLPFAYDALEPVIDARTVELPYNFHHKPAAAAANKAEEGLARARETGDFALVKFHEKELAY
jgi:Fe-Mn family superoxide dismutase